MDPGAEAPKWEEIPASPFRRRALAVAAAAGKLYAAGGMTPEGEISRRVDVYDPRARAWSAAPELPGPAFGPAACALRDSLLVSSADPLK